METKAALREAEGLTPEELDARSRARLLDDRLEMRRVLVWRLVRRAQRGNNLRCSQSLVVIGGGIASNGNQTCFRA